MKLYYVAGSQMIAERTFANGGSILYYLYSDHMGLTSATTSGAGRGTADELLA